jgi:hypothetical protein
VSDGEQNIPDQFVIPQQARKSIREDAFSIAG